MKRGEESQAAENKKVPESANLLQRRVIDSRWRINGVPAGCDSTVSHGEDLCGPSGSGSR